MSAITVPAQLDKLEEVQAFLEDTLAQAGCPMRAQMQLSIAAEEIFVNIAHYAYAPGSGEAVVSCEADSHGAVVQFRDSGTPFDPLAQPEADTTLSAAERPIGGLGILMVRKSMDEVTYCRENGQNVLTLVKSYAPQG